MYCMRALDDVASRLSLNAPKAPKSSSQRRVVQGMPLFGTTKLAANHMAHEVLGKVRRHLRAMQPCDLAQHIAGQAGAEVHSAIEIEAAASKELCHVLLLARRCLFQAEKASKG